MHFSIEKESLLDGLSKTVPVTEKRSPLPILSHILMDAADSKLVLTATDLEVGLKMNYDAEISDPGSLTVPGKKLYEIVRELPQGRLSIQASERNRITISSAHSVFELAGMDALDYPAWPTLDSSATSTVQAEKLLYLIDKTMFASSNDDSRFNLNGVLFEEIDGKVRVVATDGHRLALINEELGVSLETKMLIPKKGLLELKRLLESLKGEISIGFEQKNVFIMTDRFVMTVRLIDGDYPDYRKVIPESSDKVLKVNRAQLLQTLRRVAILTSDRNKGVTVRITPGTMEISAVHPDLGTARDEIDVEYGGDEFLIIINVSYLIEGLSSVDTDEILFELTQEAKPIVIRPEPAKDYFNLVMPMRK